MGNPRGLCRAGTSKHICDEFSAALEIKGLPDVLRQQPRDPMPPARTATIPIGCDVNERADKTSDVELADPHEELAIEQSRTDEVDSEKTVAGPESTAADGASTPRRGLRRKVLLVAAAATIGLLAVGGGTAAAMSKHVTITVDGAKREVTTLAGSVDGALASAGLQPGAHDVLAPAGDTQIADGAQIALERGRLLTLTLNGQQRDVWTTADTVDQALVQLGQDPAALSLSADRSRDIPIDGLAVTARSLRSVSVSVGGAAAAPVQTGALTVGDLLTEQGISLSATDTVTPASTTPITDGLQVTVSRVVVTTLTDTVQVPQTDVQTDDPTLDKGTTV